MYVVCVTIWVKPGFEEAFIEATRHNHVGTRKEPGNLRFDVLRKADEPTRFFLYEAYRTEEDFVAHQKTQHYTTWKQTVTEWMSQPRQGVRHHSLFPDDTEW
ncbi:MAG TPA: antibiotic biosynthesis monooxygenase [Polyangiaceae bacterium]|jgi:autoinducer 2-degrading protein|nr:MAG: Autoinducer 2-degrading protein LsrG [Deltaproteobacteria bacterium ADurb.Bin207]HNS95461.1 antibiotic biosynthesis monooxygenase [Polyangiaceae bacterium]HNZ20599.1 antibiotic biosynthesis monooxygenase [Polyangiaceae bacterium]HOD20785.1 antibiotic biosynthesis monooxygenase [Polyangiaceae bacterium]HOE47205.1 antibiotic biosynthesis monooxygenase [Polyangiaceae bacterium]